MIRTALLLAALLPAAAHADLNMTFRESAPKDSFTLSNDGACDLGPMVVTLDLSSSAAGLIFDTTASGAGVEVFQPLDIVEGKTLLASVPDIKDGMNTLQLNLTGFPIGAKVAFTIDVDDTLTQSDLGQIRVSGSEISGAQLIADGISGTFDATGTATLKTNTCLS